MSHSLNNLWLTRWILLKCDMKPTNQQPKENKTMRNRAVGEWRETQARLVRSRDDWMADHEVKPVRFAIEQADMHDTKLNHVYTGGAYRITRDGKPIRGKGGSVPFLGESAWCYADNKLDEVSWAHERGTS